MEKYIPALSDEVKTELQNNCESEGGYYKNRYIDTWTGEDIYITPQWIGPSNQEVQECYRLGRGEALSKLSMELRSNEKAMKNRAEAHCNSQGIY